MPTLPSGMKVALLIDHIMEPDINWFKATEGHFWYWTPAEENLPPFSPEDKFENVPTTAPVPETTESISKYIRVCIGLDNGNMYWRGEMLNDFPKYGSLSKEDTIFWQEWLDTDDVVNFLNSAIQKCKTQSTVNKQASGYAVIQSCENQVDGQIIGKKVIVNPYEKNH